MTVKEILAEIKSMAKENIKQIYLNHGAPENHYGVKIEDLKKIQKKVKKNHELSLELYDSGVSDAQYLAGLIADEKRISKKDLQHWADTAIWYMQSEYTVPWIAAESAFGWELALKWIDSKKESLQISGWSTLASLITIKPNDDLDNKELKILLNRVESEIKTAPDRVRYTMNSFLIAAGGYIPELTSEAIRIAKAIGPVKVDMGATACKVPYAPDYIQKMKDRGAKKKENGEMLAFGKKIKTPEEPGLVFQLRAVMPVTEKGMLVKVINC